MCKVYAISINRNLDKNEYENLLCYVTEEKKGRIRRFRQFEDSQRALLGDVLARYAICRNTGLRNEALSFTRNEYGKPLLLKPAGVFYNISHSGGWVVGTVDDSPIGIDVETVKPIDFEIAKRFFAEDEYIALMNQPEDKRLKFFYTIWTLKESYIKCLGKGLSIPLNSFAFNVSNTGIGFLGESGSCQNSCFQNFTLDSNSILSVCSSKPVSKNIKKYDVSTFLYDLCQCLNF